MSPHQKRPSRATPKTVPKRSGRPTVISLDIYIDVLCPWCYITKRNLESVVEGYEAEHADVRFERRWRPFYIMPGLERGTDKRALYERLYASNRSILERLYSSGTQHGITFSIRGTTGPSRPAHRLIALSRRHLGEQGSTRVVERLFRGYFEQGRDVSDKDWLVSVGVGEGMTEGEVRAGLGLGESSEDDELGVWVDGEVQGARARGVEAVPCVMVQGRYKVGGFQEADVFTRVFDRVRADAS